MLCTSIFLFDREAPASAIFPLAKRRALVYDRDMSEHTTNSIALPEEPWWRRNYIWLAAAAVLLAVLCVLVFLAGVADLGGHVRTQATVSENLETVQYPLRDGTLQVSESTPVRTRQNLHAGQIIPVRYREDDPATYQPYSEAMILGICLAAAALVAAALAASIGRDDRRKRQRYLRVAADGVPVVADVLNVYPDYTGFTRRSRQMYSRLDCAYLPDAPLMQTESGREDLWLFTSDRFPTPAGDIKGHVTVYVRTDAPDEYYVDLTTLTPPDTDEPPIVETII